MIRRDNELISADLLLQSGKISRIASQIGPEAGWNVIDCNGMLVTPGFIDPHVHLREPGFTDKETIRTGSRAAVKGGYTTVFAMPNVSPCPDTPQRMADMVLRAQDAPLDVRFYAPLSAGEKGEELTDFRELKETGAVALSDDGKGLQHNGLMRQAMQLARAQDLVIAAHCEDESLLNGGYIHDGLYARQHKHRGISRSVEDVQAARDLLLAHETGARYHICHMSTHRGVDLLELAQSWGARVSGEVSPHHLLLTDSDLREDGRYKMNPPLREEVDRLRLIEGLNTGVIQVIATDHAPHTSEEKSRGLAGSPFGITGLETAFPLLYTYLVKPGYITLQTLVDAMTKGPRQVFGLEAGELAEGAPADLTLTDLRAEYVIHAADHESKGRNTPFDGWRVKSRVDTVIKSGRIILQGGTILD
ncbi:dihydroorotase [Clostridiaceae bacterium HFYG-1003]|nr:dihydroorotase [Clostridiaceae bacterium HFYG-1003]